MTKKKEFNEAKVVQQANLQLPPEIRDIALKTFEACKGVRELSIEKQQCGSDNGIFLFPEKQYKDPCDRVYYVSKCGYEFNPKGFIFAWIAFGLDKQMLEKCLGLWISLNNVTKENKKAKYSQ